LYAGGAVTLTYSTICKGCWQQKHMPIPLRGVLSAPFRAVGIRPSRMNPNLCTICELMFERTMKARTVTIDATVLFADLRAYTQLSQTKTPAEMAGFLDEFYDRCANAIWRHDGLLNKTIGDAVMAIFNFPICQADHARQAVLAAREMQRDLAARRDEFGVGIGIHCGQVSFGEFGHSHRDITAIGTVVNTAARTQSAAEAGQILVTEDVCRSVGADLASVEPREYRLKGFDDPIRLYAA
jgi:adenylate cyclase